MFNKIAQNKLKEHLMNVELPYGGTREYSYSIDNMGTLNLYIDEKVDMKLKLPFGIKKDVSPTFRSNILKMPIENYKSIYNLMKGEDPLEHIFKEFNENKALLKSEKEDVYKEILEIKNDYLSKTFISSNEEVDPIVLGMFDNDDLMILSSETASIYSPISTYTLAIDYKDASIVRLYQVYVVNTKDKVIIGEVYTYDLDYEFIEKVGA